VYAYIHIVQLIVREYLAQSNSLRITVNTAIR